MESTRIPFAVRLVVLTLIDWLELTAYQPPKGMPLQYSYRNELIPLHMHWVKLRWEGGLGCTMAIEQHGDQWEITDAVIRFPISIAANKAIEGIEMFAGLLPNFHTELGRTIIIQDEQLEALKAAAFTRTNNGLPLRWEQADNPFRLAREEKARAEEERLHRLEELHEADLLLEAAEGTRSAPDNPSMMDPREGGASC